MSNEFISLKESLDAWNRQEEIVEKALECYGTTIADLERSIFRVCEAKLGEPAPQFAEERASLRYRPSPRVLDAVRQRLSGELDAAADRIDRRLGGAADLAEVVMLLGQTIERVEAGAGRRETSLNAVGSALRAAAEVRDLADFRRRVYVQINSLRQLADAMREENTQLLAELQGEMTRYRRQLDEARRLAATDPKTGLATRSQLEGEVREHLAVGVRFCLLLVEIATLAACRASHGGLAADALLAAVANTLRAQLQCGETAAHFSGDIIVVLLPGTMAQAVARSRQLQAAMKDERRLPPALSQARFQVALRAGIAESRAGDTWERLIPRAESLLYPHRACG